MSALEVTPHGSLAAARASHVLAVLTHSIIPRYTKPRAQQAPSFPAAVLYAESGRLAANGSDTRGAADAQVFEVAKCLIGGDERQAKRMPMLFSPTIGAAITARSQFGARRVIPLIHRRFRVSNSIQIQNSRWPKVSTWSGRNLRGGDATLPITSPSAFSSYWPCGLG